MAARNSSFGCNLFYSWHLQGCSFCLSINSKTPRISFFLLKHKCFSLFKKYKMPSPPRMPALPSVSLKTCPHFVLFCSWIRDVSLGGAMTGKENAHLTDYAGQPDGGPPSLTSILLCSKFHPSSHCRCLKSKRFKTRVFLRNFFPFLAGVGFCE